MTKNNDIAIVRIAAGLGNQMFQYAFALGLKESGRTVKIDTSFYLRNQVHQGYELEKLFGVDLPVCTEEERRLYGDVSMSFVARARRKIFGPYKQHYKEVPDCNYNEIIARRDITYYQGYWGSYLCFPKTIDLQKAFTFKMALDDKSTRALERQHEEKIVGIHVRRGDHLKNPSLGKVITNQYYHDGLKRVASLYKDYKLLVFSDDEEWCKKEFSAYAKTVYVDWNCGAGSYKDMQMMTQCDALIIANSTYSWWGAWLGKKKVVVAPAPWVDVGHPEPASLIPDNWIRIDSGRGLRGETIDQQ